MLKPRKGHQEAPGRPSQRLGKNEGRPPTLKNVRQTPGLTGTTNVWTWTGSSLPPGRLTVYEDTLLQGGAKRRVAPAPTPEVLRRGDGAARPGERGRAAADLGRRGCRGARRRGTAGRAGWTSNFRAAWCHYLVFFRPSRFSSQLERNSPPHIA